MLNLVAKAKLTQVSDDRVKYVSENMRESDVREVWASNRNDPAKALDTSIKLSDWSAVLVIDGDILGVVGLVTENRLGGAGVPWFLGTHNVAKHAKTFLEVSGIIIDLMHHRSNLLVNYVHAENHESINYLLRVGFKVNEVPERIGPDGELFHKFSRTYPGKRECVIQSL
jgi:hypothetical protein